MTIYVAYPYWWRTLKLLMGIKPLVPEDQNAAVYDESHYEPCEHIHL